jgi:hypothetical protein
MRWHFPSPTDEDSDPALLLWRIFQGLDRKRLPERIGIEFRFPNSDPSRGWISIDRLHSSVCTGAPEGDVDLVVSAAPRTLNEVWFGFVDIRQAVASGAISLDGSPLMTHEFYDWFKGSPFARRNPALQALR